MARGLFTPEGFFNTSMPSFTMINSYRTKGMSTNTRSVPHDLIFPSLLGSTLMLDDLNIYYPTSDPLRNFNDDEIATLVPYFNWATESRFSLLNMAGVSTRFSMSLVGRPRVLDLPFACPLLIPYFSEWSHPLPSTGSITSPSSYYSTCTTFAPPLLSQTWA